MTDRKPIFDAVRAMIGRGFSTSEIASLDAAIDAAEGITTNDTPVTGNWQSLAIPIMHEFEGYAKAQPDGSVVAYPDPATGAKPYTIGWGSTTDETGAPIPPGTNWTRERADARFAADLEKFAAKVRALIAAPTSAAQFAAMVSLAYNIGVGNFGKSTLLRKHNAGDYAGARAQFAVWNRAAGKVMAGLTRRRAAEAELYGS